MSQFRRVSFFVTVRVLNSYHFSLFCHLFLKHFHRFIQLIVRTVFHICLSIKFNLHIRFNTNLMDVVALRRVILADCKLHCGIIGKLHNPLYNTFSVSRRSNQSSDSVILYCAGHNLRSGSAVSVYEDNERNL